MLPLRMSDLRLLEGRGQRPRRGDKLRQRRTANPTKRSPAHASNPSRNGRNGLGSASFTELISAARAVRITPELADPVGPLEVGQREDVEQLGAGSGPEGVQAFLGVGARARRVSWPQGTPSYCRGALVLLKAWSNASSMDSYFVSRASARLPTATDRALTCAASSSSPPGRDRPRTG
jgi:hypothetical protein